MKRPLLLCLLTAGSVLSQPADLPVIITRPGPEFRDEVRPGAMIIGMDRTPRGRIWGCWTGTGDKRDGYFILATSDDGGDTWSKPRLVVGARNAPGQRLYGALVGNLWTDPLGRLWLFFDQQFGEPNGQIGDWYIRCDNPDADQPVWSKPVRFADGCTLNKPTILKNGDWWLPVSDWRKKTARIYVSTDQGGTWTERGSVVFPDWDFDEHMTVELRDGRLWMLARTQGQPHESFSSDGGKTWSEPRQAATVQNVNARFFLRRMKSGRILLVKNGPPTERLKTRTHMSAWLSEDDGQTWKGGLLLDERNAVSYPDGFESPDGLIHILYDWNRHTDAEILMAKFREEDVLAGKIVSPDAKLRMLANKARLKVSAGVSGIAEPGAVEPQVQTTSYGWEITDWKTADTNHEGEAVFTITPEAPLCDVTVLSYIDDKLTLEPLAPGETRTSLVFRLPLELKRAQGGAKKAAAPGSQWDGFGSGKAVYGAELPFVSILPLRVVNVAEDAVVTVSSADKLSTGFRPLGWLNRPETLTDGFIDRDRNFFSAPRDQDITAESPESVLLSWNDEQSLRLLGLMRGRGEKGLGTARVAIYTGSGDPRFARDGWELCSGSWSKEGAFRAFSLFDFGREVKTRGVRLVCTGGVKQIGLGEVLALQALGDAPVPVARKTKGRVPVQFTIPDSGKVTVQIRNAKGDVVANPIAGVEFRKGIHTVYWDLTDIAGNPVTEPGQYSWKGLYVPGLKVAYQYSYYPTPLNNVAWQTPDRDGGWLADHEPPRTICRVGDKMWLGAFAEMGDSIIEVDNSAKKLWGIDRIWVAIPSEICGDGDYYYGFCEGGWIGDNQAIIQIDTKTKASKKVFQRELKQAKGFFKNNGVSGFQVVGDRAFAAFAKTNTIMVFDISVGLRAKPRGFSWDSAYKQFDELKPVLIKEISLPAPGRIRQYGPDRLVAVSGRDIVTIDLKTYEVKAFIKDKLVNPLGLGTDAKGNLYVGEGAPLHQVFGYTPEGRKFLTLGKPGRREPGAFDNDNLEEPFGVEVASDGRIWVMEHTDWTRRVSIWDPQTAKCVKAVYGPTQYGGDGCLDPADETRAFYKGMEFRRDPVTGTVTPLNMTYRVDNTNLASFIQGSALGKDGNYPSYAFRAKGDLWFTSYMHPHGHPVLVLWLYKKGIVKPVAAMGSAFSLRTTFGEPQPDGKNRTNTDFLMKPIPGYTPDQKFFTWTDLNDDGKTGVDELEFGKLEYEGKLLEGATAGWNWRMNGNFVTAANAGQKRAVFFTPSGFTKHGYPLYAVPTNTVPGSGEGLITDSQNNAIILGGPLTCVTPGGKIKWTYRNQWPGLHAGHATTARGDEPGVLIAPTRVWGVVSVNKDLGEVVAFNSNLGCSYLMTAEDGLYIDRVFRDQRVGLLWNSPNPPTPEVLAETSLYDEHFGGLLQKTVGPDGREKFVYVVGKNHCSVVELTGLDQIQRLPGGTLAVTPETAAEAQQRRQDEILRTTQPGIYTVRKVPDGSITIDVHDKEWGNPDRIEGFALAYDSQNLYIHFRGQDDKAVFENRGGNPMELFKTGDVMDVMLQTKKGLKPRTEAGEGDIRLSFAMFDGKPVCVLYDFKIAGHQGERVPFSSPVRTIWCDRVSILPEANIAVARQNSTVLLEAAVPLKSIHLDPADLKETLGDVGRVLSDQTGTRASNRVYWSNRNTNIMSDVPSEAMLQPKLWGLFRFE